MAKNIALIDTVKRAADLVGGVPALADMLGVKRQTFYQWQRVPAERVLQIETATQGKLTRHEMRPDLYPQGEAA